MSQAAPDPAGLREALMSSPSLCPLEWSDDHAAVLFGRLSHDQYLAASFLDRRAIQPGVPTGLVPWSLAEPWLVALPRRCNFIFHISHCGSTLISRLLGSAPGLFSLREPGILRGLRPVDPETRFAAVLGLLGRTFRPEQTPLIKATSIVNAVADRLMTTTPEARAILVGVPAATFLAAVLDGSRSDIETHAAERHGRLLEMGRLEPGLASTSPGEQAAAAWACEMASLRQLADRFPDRIRWIDFDRFLAATAIHLEAMLLFLRQQADVTSILNSSVMQRYAKRTDVAYDAEFRNRLLAAARQRFGPEIDTGLNWLNRHGWDDLSADTGL